ncbi:hypothetical protein MPSEU_000714000 [Mayamaea pseudoterrestris]|nr:hypothetical protein MPSEU_000714000 [Mayamaea pseudoterrestris]
MMMRSKPQPSAAISNISLSGKALIEVVRSTGMTFDQGQKLAHTLESLVAVIKSNDVSSSDRNICNHCVDSDNNFFLSEYDGPVDKSLAIQFIESCISSLHDNPQCNSHVVDWPENATFTDDSIWLSLPKWFPHIQWSICTFRSLDRSSFRRIFDPANGWQLDLMQHGSCRVTRQTSRAFYSDQPRLVTHHGRDMARTNSSKPVIRVFRCAPRPCLKKGIQAVQAEPLQENVFDIWIRHFDLSTGDDIGTFKHDLGASVELVDMLTEVEMVKHIRKSPALKLAADAAIGVIVDNAAQDFTNVYESPPKASNNQSVTIAAQREADAGWLELLELEPESPFCTPGEVSFDKGGLISKAARMVTDAESILSPSFATSGNTKLNDTHIHSFDDSVLNPMGTELDERQKHLNKLNHLSPIEESPYGFDANKAGTLRYSVGSPCKVVQTPASSPSEAYTKFPWHTPLPATPATTQSADKPAEILLSELAAIVGGEPCRRPLQAWTSPKQLTPVKSSKKLFNVATPQATDENCVNA